MYYLVNDLCSLLRRSPPISIKYGGQCTPEVNSVPHYAESPHFLLTNHPFGKIFEVPCRDIKISATDSTSILERTIRPPLVKWTLKTTHISLLMHIQA